MKSSRIDNSVGVKQGFWEATKLAYVIDGNRIEHYSTALSVCRLEWPIVQFSSVSHKDTRSTENTYLR